MSVSDFVKIMKNVKVLRMLTRDTIVHTQHSATPTFHSLVSMPVLLLNRYA